MKKYLFGLLFLLQFLPACSPSSSDGGGSATTYTLDIKEYSSKKKLENNESYDLTSVVTDGYSQSDLGVPVDWRVEPSGYGTFGNSQENLSGVKTTTFTTVSDKKGLFNIILSYEGVEKKFEYSLGLEVANIRIWSSTDSLSKNGVAWLSAKVTDSDGTDITEYVKDSIEWKVDNKLGSLNTSTGKISTFTASNSGSGEATITVTVSGKSDDYRIGINCKPFNGIILYDDNGLNSNITEPAVYSDKEYHGDSEMLLQGESEGITGSPSDPSQGFKFIYKEGTKELYTSDGRYGGVTLVFKNHSDGNLSGYSKVCFYAKGEIGGEKMRVCPADNKSKSTIFTLTKDWVKYEAPYEGGFGNSDVEKPVTFLFKEIDDIGSSTVYVDLITIE